MAGLNVDKSEVEAYHKVQECLHALSYAGNDIARLYLNKKISREKTLDMMGKYLLMSRARAIQRLNFVETYRSYVVNYNYGQDLVKQYIEKRGGTPDNTDLRWKLFLELISSPRLPSALTQAVKS